MGSSVSRPRTRCRCWPSLLAALMVLFLAQAASTEDTSPAGATPEPTVSSITEPRTRPSEPAGVEPGPPAEPGAQAVGCREGPLTAPSPLPVAVLVSGRDGDPPEALTNQLDRDHEGVEIVGRYIVGGEADGWEEVDMDRAASVLDPLVASAERPVVLLVPLDEIDQDVITRLRSQTADGIGVLDPGAGSVDDSLRLQRLAEPYADKLREAPAASIGLRLEPRSGMWHLAADALPGERVVIDELVIRAVSGGSVSGNPGNPRDRETTDSSQPDPAPQETGCASGLHLPVTLLLPTDAAPPTLSVTGTLDTELADGTPVRPGLAIDVPSLEARPPAPDDPAQDPGRPQTEGGADRSDADEEAGAEARPGTGTSDADRGRDGGNRVRLAIGSLVIAAAAGGLWLVRQRAGTPTPQPAAVTAWPTPTSRAPSPSPSQPSAPVTLPPRPPPGPPSPGWTSAVTGGPEVRMEDRGLARVMPVELPQGRIWVEENHRWLGVGVWLEKREQLGEDAEPSLRVHDSGRGLLGVYDGTGGSGAGVVRRLRTGLDLSSAYVASRLTRGVTENWFTGSVDGGSPQLVANGLRDQLSAALRDEMAYLQLPEQAVRGSMHRMLPTTIAAVCFRELDGLVQADVMWAGDSRCYALTANAGLQVLTADDTRETDALALIRNDEPMYNLVSADRVFQLNHERYEISKPVVLMSATDGCFGYVLTPAHFEYLLLHTLQEAEDVQAWAAAIAQGLASFTADDASLSLTALGFESFAGLQQATAARHAFLDDRHWRPFEELDDAVALEHMREASWDAYRPLYHGRILPGEAR